MKVIRKKPGEGPKVVDLKEEQIYDQLGGKVAKFEVARDLVIIYDSAWRANGKHMNAVLCGERLGGTVFLAGKSEDGLTDVHNVDGALYGFFLTVRYGRVDRHNNVWQCRKCHYLQQFEADGPFENGWNVCPSCGGMLMRPEKCGETI